MYMPKTRLQSLRSLQSAEKHLKKAIKKRVAIIKLAILFAHEKP